MPVIQRTSFHKPVSSFGGHRCGATTGAAPASACSSVPSCHCLDGFLSQITHSHGCLLTTHGPSEKDNWEAPLQPPIHTFRHWAARAQTPSTTGFRLSVGLALRAARPLDLTRRPRFTGHWLAPPSPPQSRIYDFLEDSGLHLKHAATPDCGGDGLG